MPCLLNRFTLAAAALVALNLGAAGEDADQSTPATFSKTDARPTLHVVRPAATTAPTGYAPLQIRHAYGIDLLTNGGAGQVIAIVDAYGSPTMQKDLNKFSTTFGLPTNTVQIVYGTSAPKGSDAGWALETALDLQWAHAVAPNAKLILAVASSATLPNLLAAVDAAVKAGATVVTMSWISAEFPSEASYDFHFQKTNVTFLASSGDNGAKPGWPAASPSITSVGGTTLKLDALGNLTAPETGWTGSGGGFSTYFARPVCQNGWQTNSHRAFPDISLVADPATGVSVYDSTPYAGQSGWFSVGGTSASCPMWGGLVALANEKRALVSKPLLGNINPVLYAIAGSFSSPGVSLYGYFFFDVSAGSNGGFSATPNYDEVTGLGTPAALNLVPGMAAY
jgi:hypothetical protein